MDAKEASFYSAILIISIIVGIIIIYFVVSIIRQQRKNLQLHRQSVLTEITTLEKERSRIAADLHDDVGPVLSNLKYRVGSLHWNTDEDKKQMQKTNEQIDELIQRIREISFDLMPVMLKERGLVATIKKFIETYNKEDKIQMEIIALQPVRLSEHQSIHLYRIAQEIIHNALRHSKASHLVIMLKQEKQNILLSGSDDGIGFNYKAKISDASGMGLRNLLSRTELLGGKMFIESKKNKGTEYIFEIPLKA